MIINKKTLTKIKELQNETIQKAEKVPGSSEYIKKQTKLFHEAERCRKSLGLHITQHEIEASLKFAKISDVDKQFLKMNENLQKEMDMLKSIIKEQEELASLFLSA
ncbi:MAG: hypothetical protein COB99_01740 [Sulfurimonas sp.]|nr:MAG: hypothetical protein COB99_01740 [Sulfurimonas sp.]